jgi:methionine-S-sulfoxide reductase
LSKLLSRSFTALATKAEGRNDLPVQKEMRLVLLSAVLHLSAAFNAAPLAHLPAKRVPSESPTAMMSLPALASVANTGLYIALGSVAANGLMASIPRLVAGEQFTNAQYGDLAINTVFFLVAANFLAKSAGIIGRVNYASLEGLEDHLDDKVRTRSYAREAGERALAGEVASLSKDGRYDVATFAGGCFWGTELHFQRVPGVIATCVGYTQGASNAPNYEQVCSGLSGHTEATQLIFDPEVCSYESLCSKLFSTIPDATQLNRVGNDRGTQYRHGVSSHASASPTAQVQMPPLLLRVSLASSLDSHRYLHAHGRAGGGGEAGARH